MFGQNGVDITWETMTQRSNWSNSKWQALGHIYENDTILLFPRLFMIPSRMYITCLVARYGNKSTVIIEILNIWLSFLIFLNIIYFQCIENCDQVETTDKAQLSVSQHISSNSFFFADRSVVNMCISNYVWWLWMYIDTSRLSHSRT